MFFSVLFLLFSVKDSFVKKYNAFHSSLLDILFFSSYQFALKNFKTSEKFSQFSLILSKIFNKFSSHHKVSEVFSKVSSNNEIFTVVSNDFFSSLKLSFLTSFEVGGIVSAFTLVAV